MYCYVHGYVWDEYELVQKRKWIGCLKHKHEAHYAICIIIRTVDDLFHTQFKFDIYTSNTDLR